MNQDSLMDNWERIRDELRILRGRNEWRGVETHVIPKGQIRLQGEWRGNGLVRKEAIFHLSDAEVEIKVELFPDGGTHWLKEMNHDLPAFVGKAVSYCRGEGYLHTNSKSADYRKEKAE